LEATPGLKPAKGHSDKFSLSSPIEPQRESRAVRTAGTVSYSEITHLVGGQSGAFDEKERRAIIDICLAHGDLQTVEAILDYLEKSSCDWSRWPAER